MNMGDLHRPGPSDQGAGISIVCSSDGLEVSPGMEELSPSLGRIGTLW